MFDKDELREKFFLSKEEYLAIIDKAMKEVKDFSISMGEEMQTNFSKPLYHRYVGVRLKFVGLTVLRGMIEDDEEGDNFKIETRNSGGQQGFDVFKQLHHGIELKFATEQMTKNMTSTDETMQKLLALFKKSIELKGEEDE